PSIHAFTVPRQLLHTPHFSDPSPSSAPATSELYTLSLHDALPICKVIPTFEIIASVAAADAGPDGDYSTEWAPETFMPWIEFARSEEHTSELQSRENLVCRLLLEKKKKHHNTQQEHQQHCFHDRRC